MPALILHEYAASGNCYKIRLTAAHVGAGLERREYDIMKGETRSPAFLAGVNANGRIPVLQIGDRLLPESNAACAWLAHGSALIPADRFDHADMLRWMFWEQYNHEPNIATMRFYRVYVGMDNLSDEQRAGVPGRIRNGEAALDLMEEHFAAHDFLAGGRFSLADICLYAYTHTSREGGFDLDRWPAVTRWLARIAGEPRHVALED
ncbi:MAG: glutathione S-transferase family protein [Sphingomonadaceae bacterium]|nr:glutathione S-transferase family protein [Sphingomonadaceae bacterium]